MAQKTIRLLLSEKAFHSILGNYALQKHGVPGWTGASVSTLFMRETDTDKLVQVRVEVTYSPVEDAKDGVTK